MAKPRDLATLTQALADVAGRDPHAIGNLQFEFHPDHVERFADDGGWDGGNIYRYHFGFQNLPVQGEGEAKLRR